MGIIQDFEKISDDFEKDHRNYDIEQENCIEWLKGLKTVTATFTQTKFINRIEQLAEKYPDEVQICARNKSGSIVAHFPLSYIHINRLKKEMTEEEKTAFKERMKNNRNATQ